MSELLPCPFCGKSNHDRWPCEWLDGSGANVIRCAWCHGAAPMNVWNRRTAPPSAPVGVEWPLSLLRPGHWSEVYVGHRCMRLEVTYDYKTWERLMEQVEAALTQQPAAAGVSVGVVREYLDARACYEDATRKPNSHAPTLKHGDPVVLRLREARIALDAAIEKAKQPAAEPRSTHRAWRYIGENIHSLPCCCASTNDHAFGHEQAFGPEQPAAVNEAAIRYALDHARDLDDGVARVVAAIADQQPAAENDDAEQLAYCKYDWRKVCKAIRGDDEHMDPDEVVAWIEERKQPAAVDEAMVERAAKALFESQVLGDLWGWTMEEDERNSWREDARAIITAALAAQPGNLYVEDGDTEPHYDR